MKELSTYIQKETTFKNLINDNESIYLIDYEMLTIVKLQMEAGFLFVVSDSLLMIIKKLTYDGVSVLIRKNRTQNSVCCTHLFFSKRKMQTWYWALLWAFHSVHLITKHQA